jgi:hypothetical protein
MNEMTTVQILQQEITNSSTAFTLDYRLLAICDYKLLDAVILKTLIEIVPPDYDADIIDISIQPEAFPVARKKVLKGMVRLHNSEIITINEIVNQDEEYLISFYIADFLDVLNNYSKNTINA